MRSCAHGPNGDEKFSGGGPVAPVPGGFGPPERACNGIGWNKELLRFINNWSWWWFRGGKSGGGPDGWSNGGPLSKENGSF